MQNKQHLAATLTGIAAIGVFVALLCTAPVTAQIKNEAAKESPDTPGFRQGFPKPGNSAAVFTPDGKLILPKGYRNWVFVGAPLTPNALNKPEANFPEYHNVYIQAQNVDAYLKTGEFPEGTVIIKELTRLVNPTFPDGSRTEPSGRGFFNGEFNGIDATVKDSKRFAKTNNWGFFTFGHHPEPYEATAAESPASVCAGCHIANVAKTDMTWVQFYPMLLHKELDPQAR
jgi:hypothetical protein